MSEYKGFIMENTGRPLTGASSTLPSGKSYFQAELFIGKWTELFQQQG